MKRRNERGREKERENEREKLSGIQNVRIQKGHTECLFYMRYQLYLCFRLNDTSTTGPELSVFLCSVDKKTATTTVAYIMFNSLFRLLLFYYDNELNKCTANAYVIAYNKSTISNS